MASLPAICPSQRSLTFGQFAMVRKAFLNGSSYRRLYGRSRFDLRLVLQYGDEAGIPGAEAAAFLTAWLESNGSSKAVTVPSETFEGMSTQLVGRIGNGIEWHFSEEEPRITPGVPGHSRVDVDLLGRLPLERL